jgi:hypothetical protein
MAYMAVYAVLRPVIRPYMQGLASRLVQGLIMGLRELKVVSSFKLTVGYQKSKRKSVDKVKN